MRTFHLVGLRGPEGQRLRCPEGEPLELPYWLSPADQEAILAFYQETAGDEVLPRVEVDWDRRLTTADATLLRWLLERRAGAPVLLVVRMRLEGASAQEVREQREIRAFPRVAIAPERRVDDPRFGALLALRAVVWETVRARYAGIEDELGLPASAIIDALAGEILSPVALCEAYDTLIRLHVDGVEPQALRERAYGAILARLLGDLDAEELVGLTALLFEPGKDWGAVLGPEGAERARRGLRERMLVADAKVKGWARYLRGEKVGLEALGVRLRQLERTEGDVGRALGEARGWLERVGPSRRMSGSEPSLPQHLTRAERDLATRARELVDLGLSRSSLGQREEALPLLREAVTRYRELAEQRPDAFLPHLAWSLHTLAVEQSELGQWEDALTATHEAVGILRELAKQRPDAFLPHLAASLNNLGVVQGELGQREDALASGREVVARYRELVKQRPDAFLAGLAVSLHNLGTMQSALGEREDALASTREAVGIYRQLTKEHPDAFLPDLAAGLNNLGTMQSALGQWEDALASTREAVGVHRELTLQRPDRFIPGLAASLNNLGARLSQLGQAVEALASAREAVALYRELTNQRPEAFLPRLAGSLSNLGGRQSELGQAVEALASTREAVALYRELAKERPDRFLSELAMSLHNLGGRQSELGQAAEALASTREAVALYRELAKERPYAFLPKLAGSLGLLATLSAEGNDLPAARDTALEALDLLWPLHERSPPAHAALAGALAREALRCHGALGEPPPPRLRERATALGL